MSIFLRANENEKAKEVIPALNSLPSIRVMSARTWLVAILIVVAFTNAFAQTDFSAFWKKFSTAVAVGDKATVAKMTTFPLSMPAFQKQIKNENDFLKRYNEVFKGEANAAQCFGTAKPNKESARRYEVYCPFKKTPDDKENMPIRFIFDLTKSGWRFAGLDNINE